LALGKEVLLHLCSCSVVRSQSEQPNNRSNGKLQYHCGLKGIDSGPRLTIVSIDKFASVTRNPAMTWR